ncbi:MAG: hypothetical protein LBO75_04240, partial [Bifidobacteriaceae bacterium]|nr:hypothetical protein [Bifidobacteriaceae bacterium]
GTARRFELKGRAAGVKVIDDYAHHPTEISATLQAAREEAPSGRLLVLFQPHLYSRTREFAAQFAAALSAADLVWLLDVYGAREQPLPGVSSDLIADLMDPAVATRVSQFQAAPGLVAAAAHPGDLIFTMGAGDVTELGLPLLEALRQRESEGGGPSGLGSSGGFEPGGGEPLRSSELTGPAGP